MAPTYEELFEENKEVKEENKQLKEENKTLREEVAALRKMFEDHAKVHVEKPDFVKENQHHRHQKPGQKEGHEGTSRLMPDHIDETKDATICQCPDCGVVVSDVGEQERIIETVIPAKVQVKKIKVHRYWCPCCGKVVDASVADAFPNCRLGLEIYLLVAFMKFRIGMTYL